MYGWGSEIIHCIAFTYKGIVNNQMFLLHRCYVGSIEINSCLLHKKNKDLECATYHIDDQYMIYALGFN